MNGVDCLSVLTARISAAYGVDFSGARRTALADAMAERGNDLSQTCAQLLAAPEAELASVVEAALNGETYFLRHESHFVALRSHVLPTLFRARANSRRLTIWSAGCATGEEPLSLAMVALESAPDSQWRIEVTGTDLSRRSLTRATEGLYGEWSFRNVPDAVRARWFHRHGDRYRPRAELLRSIQYRRHNLLSGAPGMFDLVVCRNVIIYFNGDALRIAAETLREAIPSDGWLLAGSAESSAAIFRGLVPVNVGDAIFFTKKAASADVVPGLSSAAPVALPAGSLSFSPPAPSGAGPRLTPPVKSNSPESKPQARRAGRVRVRTDADRTQIMLRRARRLADRRELEAASRISQRLADERPLEPEVHLLRALVARERGNPSEAHSAATAALFLNPALVLANVVLGDANRAAGDAEGAARAYRNALEELSRRSDSEIVEGGSGITAKELAVIVKRGLSELDGMAGPSVRRRPR